MGRVSAEACGVVVLACLAGGCSALSVADAGVTVAANTVKVGANLVGAVSDVARAGVSVAADTVRLGANVAGGVSDVASAGVRAITNNADQRR